MKMMDCVEIIVEKDQYAKEGVHKGMQGVIWERECRDGCWVVLFPRYGAKADIADLSVKEDDLVLLPNGMDARINEQIEAQFDQPDMKPMSNAGDDMSDYLV